MPSWDRFVKLCHIRFRPVVCTNHLSELARLPFKSSVQDYQECFNTLVCHNAGLLPRQKADLFVGGLPNHICVNV